MESVSLLITTDCAVGQVKLLDTPAMQGQALEATEKLLCVSFSA